MIIGVKKEMSKSKCSKNLYCRFLEVTSTSFSAISLNEVSPEHMSLSHDSISRCLSTSKVRPQDLWESAKKEIEGKCGILGFDDNVVII